MSTVAGTGTAGYNGDDIAATSAQISTPILVSAASGGGFLFGDQGNRRARRVLPNGTIVPVAGSGAFGSGGDGGPATSAQFSNALQGAILMPDGGVLISDGNNNNVRRVGTDGIINRVAGGGTGLGDGGPATSAQIVFPVGLAVQSDGGYLIADNFQNRIRRVDLQGNISTVAGTGSPGYTGDNGPATLAQINRPSGVSVTPDGGFVFSERNNHVIRRVSGGTITTVAGNGSPGFGGDGGPAEDSQLNTPTDVAVAPDGSILIADSQNNRIRRVDTSGNISTVAGTGTASFNGDGLPGTATDLNQPVGVSVTSENDVLISDTFNNRIRLLDSGAPAPPPPPPPRAPATLTLDPATAERRPGDTNVVTATARNNDGSPVANAPIRWSVVGPNETSGTATTDAQGTARVTWEGVREGTDTLTAYVDINGTSTNEPSEPVGRATVTWTLPAPVQGRVYNLEPVSGIVKIRRVRRGKGVHGAGSNAFQTLEEAQQVGFDTIVDVRKGRVRMTTAANRAGDIQKGEFYGGIYTTTQPRTGARPVTELRLSESLICQPNRRGKVSASRARSRRLWGNGRGRFRTRGRNSTATVRGTIWLTKDSCNATQTVVREGTVTVRDLVKRKNVTVRAGKRYTARSKRR